MSVEEKATSELDRSLMEEASLACYLSEHEPFFTHQGITGLLAELYRQQSISKAALARRSGMSEVYLHQVFSGRRHPSRDRLICLCIGMELTLEDTQRLLRQASYAQLYPKLRRDAIISYGILHGMDLHAVNDALFTRNEKTLF